MAAFPNADVMFTGDLAETGQVAIFPVDVINRTGCMVSGDDSVEQLRHDVLVRLDTLLTDLGYWYEELAAP